MAVGVFALNSAKAMHSMWKSSTITRGRNMAPAVHPGRLLKRQLGSRKLSANRLALDLGVAVRTHHRHTQWAALHYRGYCSAAWPVFWQQRAILARSAKSIRYCRNRAGEGCGYQPAGKT